MPETVWFLVTSEHGRLRIISECFSSLKQAHEAYDVAVREYRNVTICETVYGA